MTNAHKLLRCYLEKQFPDAVLSEEGNDKIRFRVNGKIRTYTLNVYGDIMDADNGMFVAYSNVPHDMDWLLMNDGHIPSSWTNNAAYFHPGSVQ